MITNPVYAWRVEIPGDDEDSWEPYEGTGIPGSGPVILQSQDECRQYILDDIQTTGDPWPDDQVSIMRVVQVGSDWVGCHDRYMWLNGQWESVS